MIGACLIGLHLATYHFNRDADLNELNPGAYVSCNDWVVGTYRNSHREHSQYAGYALHIGPMDVIGGVATGYGHSPILMLLPSIKVYEHVRLTLLPPIPKATTNTAGIHLSIEF